MSPVPAKVGVFGGGRMGAGIAHAFLTAGSEVVLIEANAAAVDAALGRVASSLAASSDRGLLADGVDSYLRRLNATDDHQALADAGLVVEAVPEDPAIKAAVFSSIESVVGADAVLASNTSSLSIDGIAAGLRDPARFLGLHFFNPVPASRLVEIVVGAKTDAEIVERAQDWVTELAKTAVTVRDAPGFASSRLGVAIALEAMRMVDEGVASVEDIDAAMTLGYRHPVGPLKTTDLVGLDVRLAIAEHLERELGPRFAPPQVLRDKVAAGELGKKSGKGFYDW
ncbi:MAG: 3-hydroxyacyl-CoA dehydrogenase family protein [Actinomycetota bacterium]|nr:3-hydroxyacyl-CoA dehydrogenase family protein [Actinomycetota bacterium]